MIRDTKPIAQTNHFIVLDQYTRQHQAAGSYQSEADLERELVRDLENQGYEYRPEIKNPQALLANVRIQLQTLNNIQFTEGEWKRFVETWLDRPNDGTYDKAVKIHEDCVHDFTFDDGHIQNIHLFNRKHIIRNTVQVINQMEQSGTHANRYDVTILVNGLPLVQIELKKRGIAIREAFNQIHRYSKESFNHEHSLYRYLQLFVISNGTDTRYFANTTKRDMHSFDFTMNWANAKNEAIRDLKDFTATFFEKTTLLNVLLKYCVLDVDGNLLVMRPYQIAATERILWKIRSSFEAGNLNQPESGGFIWHTTGSGKTLTSFKAARLATELDFINRVFFVVDRKDLDFQTMKEYQRFSPDSVNGSVSTAELKSNLEKDDNRIIVTTIQKLHNLMKGDSGLAVYNERVVLIFDECHRSQFGEAQKNLKKKFRRFCQFGFTGTPIFRENASGAETTDSVFGRQLHTYVITDAIRDEKVLKFKVDYNNVRPTFRGIETERDEQRLSAAENRHGLQHPDRIREISRYILDNFDRKTHRMQGNDQGSNAMFAVSSIDAAKLYYETLKGLQADRVRPLRIATIFSFAANEEQGVVGNLPDESFEVSAMNSTAKEFLGSVIDDYNGLFGTSFQVDGEGFQNYYRDLSRRMKKGKVDLLIVVGMFLTGFDAPRLNTLFVDRNLRYHGLIQAYSRTNRILDATKSFGNIVTFRDLEQATVEAITLFGNQHTTNMVLERSYREYMEGFTDELTGEVMRGFVEVAKELEERFPDPSAIEREADKKGFVVLFGEYLRGENVLQNYDEFAALKAFQSVDSNDRGEVEAFKAAHYLGDEDLAELESIRLPNERMIQDYRSTYNDIRDWFRRERDTEDQEQTTIEWDDVVFEVDLIKSQEINLDYILKLIFEKNRAGEEKIVLIDEIRRIIRASLGSRAKESLVLSFIEHTDLDEIGDVGSLLEAFYSFATNEMRREAEKLIEDGNLRVEPAKRYLTRSLKNGFASEHGTELNGILPTMSPLNTNYLKIKREVFQQCSAFVETFSGVSGGDMNTQQMNAQDNAPVVAR